jgi:hypothetical protein
MHAAVKKKAHLLQFGAKHRVVCRRRRRRHDRKLVHNGVVTQVVPDWSDNFVKAIVCPTRHHTVSKIGLGQEGFA